MVIDHFRQLFSRNRRAALREARDQEAYLFSGVVALGAVRLLDLSTTGLRVALLRRVAPEKASRVLLMRNAHLLDVAFVWSSGDEAGFRNYGFPPVAGLH